MQRRQVEFVDKGGMVAFTFTKTKTGMTILAEEDSYSEPSRQCIVLSMTSEEARKLKEFLDERD